MWIPVLACLLFLLVLAIVHMPVAALNAYRQSARRRRAYNGLCLHCGYDLRASPHRCPECGLANQVFHETAPGRTARPLLALLFCLLAIVVIVGACLRDDMGPHAEPKVKVTKAMLSNVRSQIAQFHTEFGRHPTAAEGLAALVTDPGTIPSWNHPFMDKLPRDAWQNEFIYRAPGTNGAAYDLYSIGPNGQDDAGQGDDICLDDPSR